MSRNTTSMSETIIFIVVSDIISNFGHKVNDFIVVSDMKFLILGAFRGFRHESSWFQTWIFVVSDMNLRGFRHKVTTYPQANRLIFKDIFEFLKMRNTTLTLYITYITLEHKKQPPVDNYSNILFYMHFIRHIEIMVFLVFYVWKLFHVCLKISYAE